MKRARPRKPKKTEVNEGEFLWLISLSDMMILLFVFFVVLFSFTWKKMAPEDVQRLSDRLKGKTQATQLDEIQAKLLRWVVDRKLLREIEVGRKEDSLVLEIREHLLFASGEYKLRKESQELVAWIGKAIEKIPSPYRIGIEGHTDDSPLPANGLVRDNWQLSALRADSVLQALRLQPEQAKRALILGYGEMRPLAPNRDEKGKPIAENQAQNRRVTVRIF